MLTKQQRRLLTAQPATDSARLRYAMDKKLMTQERLELLSGVSQSTISNILRGERREWSLPNAFRLAMVFGLRVEDLFPETVNEVQTRSGK